MLFFQNKHVKIEAVKSILQIKICCFSNNYLDDKAAYGCLAKSTKVCLVAFIQTFVMTTIDKQNTGNYKQTTERVPEVR